MIQHIFNNFYYRLIIAFVVCLMIAFVDKFELFHRKWVTAVLFVIIVMMWSSNLNNDYGLLLLIIALFILSYNMSVLRGGD